MKSFPHLRVCSCLLWCSLLLMVSCRKDELSSHGKPWEYIKNRPPVVNAGPDQVIVLPVNHTTLYGAGSDVGNQAVTFEWTKSSGPGSGIIRDSRKAITAATNLEAGTYTFELKAVDTKGLSATDMVTVKVLENGGDPCYGCWDY